MRLLVSVRNKTEAMKALKGGCDILDIKNPQNGSLGRADRQTIREILSVVSGRLPVSAACGELADMIHSESSPWPENLSAFSFLKAGPAELRNVVDWPERWGALVRQLKQESVAAPTPVEWVAVIYADGSLVNAPTPLEIFAQACRIGCVGILIDTCQKGERQLGDWLSPDQLQEWRQRTREAEMFLALAGSLRLIDLPVIHQVHPDIVAIRGAVCRESERTNDVDENLVRVWKAELTRYNSQSSAGLVAR